MMPCSSRQVTSEGDVAVGFYLIPSAQMSQGTVKYSKGKLLMKMSDLGTKWLRSTVEGEIALTVKVHCMIS